ncbi:hypothetical protein AMIS_34100 [Actinoplanes missouriensis 431]|uniref:Uncharacterized protein n=1 Tax=Actinoplanes missouriensis (strain ATCC 14538 / DSM 43046 / CBS 188.64 / JCM 3121 / NBRC 102363 / NCIMB 12654 / NRRL B-3342 / UNCC 431) TaxID=512565 RepID=I0H6J3_ACTM4|nr:hypothetical protein [Actinoplanes missouriensis]BAL88630.1 hypothetical protein AMIS_34100 [Actinoplanes missouriensis 431]
MTTPRPLTVHLHCRLTVTVDDPDAVTGLAVQRLREAAVDWEDEDDDLATATVELRADLLRSIAGLADPEGLLRDVPGAQVTGAHVWAEPAARGNTTP